MVLLRHRAGRRDRRASTRRATNSPSLQAERRQRGSVLADIGLHAGGWGLERMRSFYRDEAGFPEARIWGETTRNSILPATRLMYFLGTRTDQGAAAGDRRAAACLPRCVARHSVTSRRVGRGRGAPAARRSGGAARRPRLAKWQADQCPPRAGLAAAAAGGRRPAARGQRCAKRHPLGAAVSDAGSPCSRTRSPRIPGRCSGTAPTSSRV